VITWRLEGGAAIARELATLRKRVSRKLEYDALMAGGEHIRREGEKRAPLNPLSRVHLKAHILLRRARDPEGGGAAAVAIGPARRTWWGAWQEWGTAHHRAQPYLRPAFDAMVQTALKAIKTTLAAGLLSRGLGVSGRGAGGGIGDVIPGPSAPRIGGGPGGGGLL
jgi:HK97 gp10 family phage protein